MTKTITLKQQTLTQTSSYQGFIKILKQDIQLGATQIQQFIDQQKVRTNWQIGKRIDAYLAKHTNKKLERSAFYFQLADDLGVTNRLLQQTVQFYRTYPKLNTKLPFNWTHYSMLITLPTNQERIRWQKRIVNEQLSATSFKSLMKQERLQNKLITKSSKFKFKRGKVYLYRIIKSKAIHKGFDQLMVDVGFGLTYHLPPKDQGKHHSGVLVESIKEDDVYDLVRRSTGRDDLYTYMAWVERVVDGDTLVVNIDCGFGMHNKVRLRLRGIDAPEMPSTKGRMAKDFVNYELKPCEMVVLRTYKSNNVDKYGRYLADVFYFKGAKSAQDVASRGKCLNVELLDRGLAQVY